MLPAHQSLAQILGSDLEDPAQVVKGEKAVGVGVQNPLFGVCKHRLPFGICCQDVVLKTANGVLEYREHEPILRLCEDSLFQVIKKLSGQNPVGRKNNAAFV